MDNYRKDIRDVEREARWTFWRFMPLFLIVIIILSIVGFGLNGLGLFGKTFVERKVFEQSYQYNAGMEHQGAIWRASIAEIDRKLMDTTLTGNTRTNLESQRSALNIQLNAIINR